MFAEPLTQPGLFTFSESVAGVFPDMINRSVPGYGTVVAMTGVLAAQHARPRFQRFTTSGARGARHCYLSARKIDYPTLPTDWDRQFRGHAGERARLNLQEQLGDPRVVLAERATSWTVQLDNASVVILNYTLQFVPIKHRETLLRRIRSAMQPGDVLILSEKLTLPDPQLNDYLIELHHNFKRQQGYSDLEIAQKRQALEDVLIPETRHQHVERLHRGGL